MARHCYPFFPIGEPPRLVAAWLMLAITALGLSALFAVVLVVGRTPYLARLLPLFDGFHRALVLHVTLAAFVWFLAFAAALWNAVCTGARTPRWAGFGLGVAGIAAIALSPLAGDGGAVLSNYLPMLDNTVFFAGLVSFGTGIVLTATSMLAAARPWILPVDGAGALRVGIVLAAVPVLAAGVSWSWSLLTLPAVLPAATYFDLISWGAGHVLQFAHVLLMMVAWLALAAACGIGVPLAPRAVATLFAVSAAPALAAPVIHALYPVATSEFRFAFTALMSYGSWIVAGPLGVLLLARLLACRGTAQTEPGLRATLALSIILFLAGCAIGTAIRGETTLVPAHYHGTIGAVTVAYMAFAARLLPQLGYTSNAFHLMRWPLIYGAGLVLMVLGLAWSGSHSLPRKTGWAQASGNIEVLVAMGLAGAGGTLAVAAGALFVLFAWRAVWRRKRLALRRDTRLRALAVTFAVVASGGIALAWVGEELSRPAAHATSAPDPIRQEILQRFQQGVIMLHAKQHEHAMTAFHRVLELDPAMPEAHVNMGFALIGMQRHGAARDFFESAIALRKQQVNAYYGLAVALDELHDRPGAIGAMRTFVHLSKPDDPYQRKAQAALWEWEAAREQTGAAAGKAR